MKRQALPVILVLAVSLLVVACGSGSARRLPTPGPAGEPVIRVEMQQSFFSPSSLTIRAGRKYLLELHNAANVANNLRIAGPDGEFNTEDDIVSDLLEPGETANLELLLEQSGVFDFRSDPQALALRGTLTVWEAPATVVPPTPTPSPTPTPTPTPEPFQTIPSTETLTPATTPTPEPLETLPPEPTETSTPGPMSTPVETP